MYSLPNLLTLSRIAVIPLVFLAVYFHGAYNFFAGVLFIAASITDYYDGKLARDRGEVSAFGRLLDPIADKFLVCCGLFLIVEYNIFSQQLILPVGVGAFCCALIISRELLVSIVRQIGASNGVVIHANKWGKIKAIFSFLSFAKRI